MKWNGVETRYMLAVSGMLLIGGGLLYSYLTVTHQEVPATLLIFLGGALVLLRSVFVQEQNLDVSKKTADKTDTNAELLEVIKGAILDGKENMQYIDSRFGSLDRRLEERTERFDRIESVLKEIDRKVSNGD